MPDTHSLLTQYLSKDEARALVENLSDERLLTRDQAADFLAVSPRTIDGWCANVRTRRRRTRSLKETTVRSSPQRLPYIKLGGRVLFQLGDLRRFRDERKVAA